MARRRTSILTTFKECRLVVFFRPTQGAYNRRKIKFKLVKVLARCRHCIACHRPLTALTQEENQQRREKHGWPHFLPFPSFFGVHHFLGLSIPLSWHFASAGSAGSFVITPSSTCAHDTTHPSSILSSLSTPWKPAHQGTRFLLVRHISSGPATVSPSRSGGLGTAVVGETSRRVHLSCFSLLFPYKGYSRQTKPWYFVVLFTFFMNMNMNLRNLRHWRIETPFVVAQLPCTGDSSLRLDR